MKSNTFRLFISSTFSDFLTEREILNDEIYPLINDYCMKRGYDFQLVDLRWGVNQESSLRHDTVEICLNEVRRCRDLSPRPNFLIMVGERYGWVPLPSTIKQSLFEVLVSNCKSTEKDLLQQWYLLDENASEPEYCLSEREGEYIDENNWAATENEIRTILLQAAKRCNLDDDTLQSFTSSATEKEILEGLLSNSRTAENTLAFFREGYPDKDQDLSQVDDLKNRIIEKISRESSTDRIILLDYTVDAGYREHFKRSICDMLLKNISSEIERLQEAQEQLSLMDMLEDELVPDQFISSRRDVIDKIRDYIDSDINVPLFIYGESGSGKTSALAELVSKYEGDCFFTFYGLGDDSFELISALSLLVESIRDKYDTYTSTVLTKYNAAEALYKNVYSIPPENNAVIIIDGLEMFQDLDHIKENVIPESLPANVKMIISSARIDIVQLFSYPDSEHLNIDDISEEDSLKAVQEILEHKGRIITNREHQTILKDAVTGGCSPLKIKIVSDIASRWKSFHAVKALPTSVYDLAVEYLESMFIMFGHEKHLCQNAYALINVSPYGIMENELQDLLLTIDEVRDAFERENKYAHTHGRLPFVVWSRLFYDLSDCATLHMSQGKIVVRFKHSIFNAAVTGRYANACERAASILADYYLEQETYLNDEGLPNVRKVYMLPELLHFCSRDDVLEDLYKDLAFSDGLIKSGRLDYFINDLQNYHEKGRFRVGDVLYVLLDCVKDNYNLLSCYRDRLEQCMTEASVIQDKESIIEKATPHREYRYLPFNYSRAAKISVNEEKTHMAVYSGAYVFICRLSDMLEECRVYMSWTGSSEEQEIKDVKWMTDNGFVIITQNKVLLYQFCGARVERLQIWAHSGNNVDVDASTWRLFFIKETDLFSVDLKKQDVVYTIKNVRTFDIDAKNNTIVLLHENNTIVEHDLLTAELTSSAPVRIKKSMLVLRKNLFRLTSTGEEGYILWTTGFGGIVYLSKLTEKISDVMLPFRSFMMQPLVGDRYIAYCYSSTVFLIDLQSNLEMTYLKIPGAHACFWKEKDRSLFVICDDGIQSLQVSSAQKLPQEYSRVRTTNRLSITSIGVWNFIDVYKAMYLEKRFSHYNDYGTLFFNEISNHEKASLLAFADDGKYALAYELNDTIIIFDKNGEELLRLNRLHLSALNNILLIKFSPDSSKLLIWRTYSIEVIDVAKGRRIKKTDVRKRPAFNVSFSNDSSQLDVLLCNEKHYIYSFAKRKWIGEKMPVQASPIDPEYKDNCFGIYKTVKNYAGAFIPLRSFNGVWEGAEPTQWFDNMGAYANEDLSLFMGNGTFYLNNHVDMEIDSTYFDFDEGRVKERLKDTSIATGFLREKNDIMSDLYSLDDKHQLLVCRALRAVILFDIEYLYIVSIHKLHADIIGSKFNEERNLEVFCNQPPYKTVYNVNYELLQE